MEGVTVREYGLSFVGVCLRNYLGKSWPFFLIFLAGIAVMTFLGLRGKKKENPLEVVTVDGSDRDMKYGDPDYVEEARGDSATWTFLSVLLMCLVTVCNPFLARILVPKFGMTPIYYRFFWVLPVTTGAAYYITKAAVSIRRRMIRILGYAALLGVLAVLIPLNPGVMNLKLPTNVYKVDGAVPVLCDAIHEDFKTTRTYEKAAAKLEKPMDHNSKEWLKRSSRMYPVCVFPYSIEFSVRQYDPTIRLLFNRNLRLYYEGNRSTGITYGEGKKSYQRRALILDAMYGRDDTITVEAFQKEMKRSKAKYLIVEEAQANGGFLVQAGCTQVGVTAGYTIFRYGK